MFALFPDTFTDPPRQVRTPLSLIWIVQWVPDTCLTMHLWSHASNPHAPTLFSDFMGPGGHGFTPPTLPSVQSRVHVQPCTHKTMSHSGWFDVAPCGSMESRAKLIQVAMRLRGKMTDNGHGSVVSWASAKPMPTFLLKNTRSVMQCICDEESVECCFYTTQPARPV